MWSLWMDVTDEWTAAMRQDLLGDESLNVQYRVAESGFLWICWERLPVRAAKI